MCAAWAQPAGVAGNPYRPTAKVAGGRDAAPYCGRRGWIKSDSDGQEHTRIQSTGQGQELRRQLEEAEQTLQAIRHGDVDALVVIGPQGEQVYTLAGAEHVCRLKVHSAKGRGTAILVAVPGDAASGTPLSDSALK